MSVGRGMAPGPVAPLTQSQIIIIAIDALGATSKICSYISIFKTMSYFNWKNVGYRQVGLEWFPELHPNCFYWLKEHEKVLGVTYINVPLWSDQLFQNDQLLLYQYQRLFPMHRLAHGGDRIMQCGYFSEFMGGWIDISTGQSWKKNWQWRFSWWLTTNSPPFDSNIQFSQGLSYKKENTLVLTIFMFLLLNSSSSKICYLL